MTDTITIVDPELAAMFEDFGAPSMSDIPGAVTLGRTEDGRTRDDFEDEIEFEMKEIMLRITEATIADLSEHLVHEGKKARADYLRVLGLSVIRDEMLKRVNGDRSANFWETLNGHLAEHGEQAT